MSKLAPTMSDAGMPNFDSVCGDVDACALLDEHIGIAYGKPKSEIRQKAEQEIKKAARETAAALLRETKDFYDDIFGKSA